MGGIRGEKVRGESMISTWTDFALLYFKMMLKTVVDKGEKSLMRCV